MTKTTNYQLNQWAKSDRVLMEDFNADNAKIDAALSEVKSAIPLRKLASLTLTETSDSATIDLSDFDMTQFCRLDIFLRGCAADSCSEYINLRCNDLTSGYLSNDKDYGYIASVRRGTNEKNICCTAFQLYLGNYLVGAGQCGYVSYSYYHNGEFSYHDGTPAMLKLSPADLRTLTIFGGLSAGTQISVFGLLG